MATVSGPVIEQVNLDTEKTNRQVVIASDDVVLSQDSKLSGTYFKKVRDARKHPTVRLARQLAIAPILAADWSFEATDEAPPDAKEFIKQALEPMRNHLLRTSLMGCVDFGFQPYEKVLTLDPKFNKIKYQKIKPLLQDNTQILVEPATGSYAGLRQVVNNQNVDLQVPESLLVYIDVEGTNWYGQPIMDATLNPLEWWHYTNDSNIRFDRKIAGAHWVIHYPPGTTPIGGVPTDNYELAKSMLTSLQSSGGIIVPKFVEALLAEANSAAGEKLWEIEILGAYPTSNVSFLDRLKYLDALIARAFGLPERAVLEGQFGTKAEAEAHADFAITNMELRHKEMVQIYNWHMVNQLLRLNWGPQFENTVFISVSPIVSVVTQFLRTIFTQFLNSPNGVAVAESIDFNAMQEKLGVPILSAEARAEMDAAEAERDINTFNEATAVQ